EEIVKKHQGKRGPLKLMLHDVQHELGYIPFQAMEIIAKGCDVPVTEVYGVVTFYTQFTTQPRGKHVINVCLGTACYVKESQPILDRITETLQCNVNETTQDGMYSIDATRCLGACGLAPVVVVDGKVYGSCSISKVDEILQKVMN
ncbi:MAG: NAD(P)H-dependent oxidoreductase subunit E, partial [Erysipelotrichales bacterium]|nr:NAD(P)H-dependent oxidoreductase subunit E [Erysipelotrichales bacterium]